MILSCCSWAIGGPEPDAHQQLLDMGFKAIDIRPSMLRSPQAAASREAKGFDVCCIALTHERPDGASFVSSDPARVKLAMDHVRSGLDHAAELGIRWGYVVPGPMHDGTTLDRHSECYATIAEYAEPLRIKVCIEHFPGTCLPTVDDTLAFIASTGHDNLYIVFDIGHAQMANEDPREVLTAAGDRLAYVHLDDNDGVEDLHLALTDGVQTEDSLKALFQVLADLGYDGPVSLEIKETLPDPRDAIDRSQQLARRIADLQ